MKELNYYEILEIKESASTEVIKAAYKALAKKYHPDSRSENNYDYQKTMADINEAYEILSDEKKRREYDLKRKTYKESGYTQEQYKTSAYGNEENKSHKNEDVETEDENTNDEGRSYANEDLETNDEENDDENGGFLGKIIRGIGKEITRTIHTNSREIENAYLEGLSLDDYTLIKKFKYSKGYRRTGYIKALEQKELLERDYNGRLIPSHKFKQWF